MILNFEENTCRTLV